MYNSKNPDEGMIVSLSTYQNKLQESLLYLNNLRQLFRDSAKFMLFSQFALEQDRHINAITQDAYDKQRGLIIRP